LILNQIVAVAANLAIGKDNDLLWHYSEDLKFFKETTSNKIIIMGRKTFDSLLKPKGKPLPNRFHIVISRIESKSDFENVRFVKTIEEAYSTADMLIKLQGYAEDIFVIGGAEIYKQTMPDCQKLYVTRVNKPFDGDVFYSPAFQIDFTLESSRPSLEHPEITYEIWTKS
jgi:dihydrofolate reductase